MKTLTLIGRRWFRRGPGGTYHTVEIIVDGKLVHKTDVESGYDDHYKQTAVEWLEKKGLLTIPRHANGSHEPLWRFCQEAEITLVCSVSDVARERDL